MSGPLLQARGLAKGFTLHGQGRLRLEVLRGIDLEAGPGECLLLEGPSGCGKSTLLRTLYGNYRADAGIVLVRHDGALVDLAAAPPRLALELRRRTIGRISQFLRVIPRVPTLEVVAEPLRALGVPAAGARERAAALLERLALPARLWSLPPATFSGGEQQRVNIARGLIAGHLVLLVDEPTAALDADNRDRAVTLLCQARDAGAAMVAICHDAAAAAALATRRFALPARGALP